MKRSSARSENWMRSLPEGWQVKPLFALFRERGEMNDGYKTDNVLSVLKDVGVVNYEDKGDVGNKKSEDIERYKIVHPGDIVINSMNVIIGSVGLASEYGALSPVYIVLTPRAGVQNDARFYNYVFASREFQRWLTRIGYGILAHRMRIPMTNLKREYVPLPSPAEQKMIADFLDRETAKADALVAKYERLIDLLEEKRTALITQAVTKGLDPSVPMKDSGVEWIGDMPAHWEITPIRHLPSTVQTGSTPDESLRASEGLPWYKPGDFLDNLALQHPEEHIMPTRPLNAFPSGSVLVVGIGATTGKVAVACEDCTTNQQINAIVLGPSTLPRFVAYAIAGLGPSNLRAMGNASTLPILTQRDLKAIRIAVPPNKCEQERIAKHLDDATARIFELQGTTRRAIALVHEHRSALITAAVTGQIDVRTYRSQESRELEGAIV